MKTCRTLLALALGILPAAAIQAQTVINSLPYTISTPGDYVLGGNLAYNGNGTSDGTTAAITFAVGNVTLDFAGHFISGLGAGSGTTATGLYGLNRANITVQNGTVVGFQRGIFFEGVVGSGGNNTGNVVTNVRLPSNTFLGVQFNYPTTCRVEGCQVNKVGGTIGNGANSSTFGIYAFGGSVMIRNNQVSSVTPVGAGTSYGIYCSSSATHFVVGNQVDTCGVGVFMSAGGKRQDNLTANCTTAFSGGTDAGGNN